MIIELLFHYHPHQHQQIITNITLYYRYLILHGRSLPMIVVVALVMARATDCQKRFACAATTGPVVEKGGNESSKTLIH